MDDLCCSLFGSAQADGALFQTHNYTLILWEKVNELEKENAALKSLVAELDKRVKKLEDK